MTRRDLLLGVVALVLLGIVIAVVWMDDSSPEAIDPADQVRSPAPPPSLLGAVGGHANPVGPPAQPVLPAATKPSLDVRTVDADDAPVAGAVVSAHLRVMDLTTWFAPSVKEADVVPTGVRAKTAADGAATLDLPEDWSGRDVVLDAVAPTKTLSTLRGVVARPGAGEVRLLLEPAALVRGRVLGLGDAPIGAVYVDAYCVRWSEAPDHRRIELDELGEFSVPGVVEQVTLVARAPGRLPSATSTLKVAPGEVKDVVLEIGPLGARGEIRLRAGRNRDVPSGSLVLVEAGVGSWSRLRTGESGRLTLDGRVREGAPFALFAWPTREPATGRWLTAQHRRDVPFSLWHTGGEVVLPEALAATFRLRRSNGTPLSGVPVLVFLDGKQASDRPILSDAGGTIDLGHAPEALATAEVRLQVLDSIDLWSGKLDASPQEIEVVRDDIVPLRIRLVDAAGEPRSSWSIRARLRGTGGGSRTIGFRESGTYATWLERDAADDLVLFVDAYDGSVLEMGALRTLGMDVAVPAPPGTAAVDVRLVTAGGAPSSGPWMVDLHPLDGPGRVPGTVLRGFADETGRVSILGVPAGSYRWVARLGAKTIEGNSPFSVAPGVPTEFQIVAR